MLIRGTQLRPDRATESDIRIELETSPGPSPRGSVRVKPGSYTNQSVEFEVDGPFAPPGTGSSELGDQRGPVSSASESWPVTRGAMHPTTPRLFHETAAGPLYATLWVSGATTGVHVQVGTVVAPLTVTPSFLPLAQNAEQL